MARLDTLAAHQGESICHLAKACECILHFLPSYSPDLLPIEETFAKRETSLRRAAAGRQATLQRLPLHRHSVGRQREYLLAWMGGVDAGRPGGVRRHI